MKSKKELEKGLYFVHGYYASEDNERDTQEPYHNQMIVMKDSMDDIEGIEAYDIDLEERDVQNRIPQGEFVYYSGEGFQIAEDNPTSIMYRELNEQLIRTIVQENYENQPEEVSDSISDVYSYHVNVGHGNCSIIVFCDSGKYNIWMVDCSVFDFTNKKNYRSNLDACMDDIGNRFKVDKISKLLVTHLHYDHINGIEYLIKKGWIDENTEVWMNARYPWKQPTYNRILLQLKALGVVFIDPIVGNSTRNIGILYPSVSFNKKKAAPMNNINNASVLYQVCLAGQRMLFTGDIEKEGWQNVRLCFPHLKESTYYCISHHGSITGHIRDNCVCPHHVIETLADCASTTRLQILMGRDGAYKGIFSKNVVGDFHKVLKTDDAKHYIEIEWSKGISVYK